MKKVAFYTLGCKVNQYETEAMTELFEAAGFETTDFDQYADVYVINTCTVTNLGDRKSRQMIRRAKKLNAHSIVAVVGCYAQTAAEEVSKIEGVNLIIGTKDRAKIVEFINELEEREQQINAVEDIMNNREFEDMKVTAYKERTRAFLKIQEGCNQFCSYCIIPYARGPVRSRKPEDIVEEVQQLAHNGFKEIVFAGIHVASYGKDLKNTNLIDIIQRVHKIEGIQRLRLSSIEPMTLSEEFVNAAVDLLKLCPHYHISLQSGCDETLRRMNRKYNTEDYARVVQRLRTHFPHAAVTTDVMVGFPGETEEEFEKSRQFVDQIGFSKVHVFKYSPRKGTPAVSYPGQVSPEEKERRSKAMMALSAKNEQKFYQNFIHKEMDVLIEQQVKDMNGYYEGLTGNYIRVIVPGDKQLEGRIIKCKLKHRAQDHMKGDIV
ncbi:tRNA (N(6)-L-threonylcarbamoyladenosine(37)-C(2))-methylthiotransferase MtaB [Petroclostridium sp. X23]|uniref:tRNA (N(6)-L-threonylcarbamoyladenosine(37)-C(2))- methylthiotransferase MtaB n=1 Tax=Petroclostridium sp. X23 TaxID=3045146 RepID=UPI0024AC878B|nr:tRNA (N(6)-L-threonylcarbamoyladenosine(37)-C(2))-methylthiotransferase MtaB [Petroclostridium sp. X23]WHH60381.1 tRNA (N(6)-L-threonylcarbamoyladenosine(37)-C(2))-methylthiotransferase MtaB [Petroclostridium sp. X23]